MTGFLLINIEAQIINAENAGNCIMKNKIRIFFQLTFVTLILYVAARPFIDKSYVADFEQYCPFGGISSFFSKLNTGAMACSMNETQIFLGLGLLLTAGLIGKLFCSYVCPIGTVSEWIGRLGDKLKIRREIKGNADRYLRGLKYILLFITVYYTMTSSELFCKLFDPYFATANGFNNSDIALYYAIPAFLITVVGALVFRLFWCKYLCPLGAITNIFMNVAAVASIVAIYLLLNLFGAQLSLIWLIGGLALVGMINELGFMRSFFLPAPKITRSDSCSACGLCDAKCPQGIKISEMKEVNHIDCNLCTDCVYTCPKANTLSISKKRSFKYLSPAAVIVIIAIALGVSSFYEFTTLSVRWGKPAGQGAVYTQAGIKNIKCFGSSKTLAGTLEGINGIYGLDTYTKSHTVKVYYDPSVISEKEVKESLFTPVKMELTDPGENLTKPVGVFKIGIYGVFDQIDFGNLSGLLKAKNGILGYETEYGEPIAATIYFNPSLVSGNDIRKQIELKSIVIKTENGTTNTEQDFKTADAGQLLNQITLHDYKKLMFDKYDEEFNNYSDFKTEQLSVFQFSMPEAADGELSSSLAYLVSHLSGNEGIVRFRTGFDEVPCGFIYFDKTKVTLETIKALLVKPKFTVFTSETETEDIVNPFHIKPEGKIINAKDLK